MNSMTNLKSRLHTADHILCTILQEKGAVTRAMQFKEDTVRITFESSCDLTLLKEELEKKVNEIIWKNFEVIHYTVERKDAEKITDLSMVPESVKNITVYEIKGFNKVACSGPHVNNTKSVGIFRILKIEKKGKNAFSIYYTVDDQPGEEKKMTANVQLLNAKGTQDFPPEEKILRDKIEQTFKTIFELYGFSPLETPVLERYDLLASKYAGGAEILKETFKLIDQGKRELGLRYDLTVPFCRFIGMNPNLKMPFKRYQIGTVYRDGPVASDRLRVFTQCDVDIVGSKSMAAEAECLLLADEAFKKLKIKAIIEINNRKLLDGMLEDIGVPEAKWIPVILIIDKIKKISKEQIEQELEEQGLTKQQCTTLFSFLEKKDLTAFKKLKSAKAQEGLKELEELFALLKGKKNMVFTPTLSRGLAYYTGTVFEVVTADAKSSIAGGGRYDKMIQQFLGSPQEYPAVGISFGLDRICLLEKAEKIKTVTQVFVVSIDKDKEAREIARALREAGIKTETDIVGRGPSKNLAYANSLGIPYVLFVGADEVKSKKYKFKNMKTGKEFSGKIEEIVEKLCSEQ
jgi:histidyl-tRNA synthetase